jgi:hypothetical protein
MKEDFKQERAMQKGQRFAKFFSGAIVVNRLILIDEYAKTPFPKPPKRTFDAVIEPTTPILCNWGHSWCPSPFDYEARQRKLNKAGV